MLYVRGVRDESGTLISVYNVGTINTITTEGINTERASKSGLLFVLAGGSVTTLQRQVSIDNTNWYNAYGNANGDLTTIVSAISNSRLIMLNNIESSSVISPYTRFTFVGTGLITTLSLYYLQKE